MITAQQADTRFWQKVEKTPTCWLWQGVMSNGVPGHFIHLGKRIMVRRKAWETFHGPIPPRHRLWVVCRVPRCIRPVPGHLEALPYGVKTPMPHGARHHLAGSKRLTWQEVLILNGLACMGLSNWKICAIFAISEPTVNAIVTKRHQWQWLTRYLPRAQRVSGRRRADGSLPARQIPSKHTSKALTPVPVVAHSEPCTDAEISPEAAGAIFSAWKQRMAQARIQ